MPKLTWSKRFKQKFDKWLRKHPELLDVVKEKLKLFAATPNAHELNNHKLSGKLKEYRAISIDQDNRIVFQYIANDEVLLTSIGTHDEVYNEPQNLDRNLSEFKV